MLHDCIYTIYFLDNKMSILWNMEPLRVRLRASKTGLRPCPTIVFLPTVPW